MAFGLPRFGGRKPRMENMIRMPRVNEKPRQPRLGIEPHENRLRTDSHIVKPYRPKFSGNPTEY